MSKIGLENGKWKMEKEGIVDQKEVQGLRVHGLWIREVEILESTIPGWCKIRGCVKSD